MGIDRTPAQKRLRKKEKECVALMRHFAKCHRKGQLSDEEYDRRIDQFTKDIAAIHEEELRLGMDLWTIDLG